MAGHVVATYLRDNGFEVDTLSAKNRLDKKTHLVDVTDLVKFKNFLDSNKFDVVVNCIGLLVKESEQHQDLAVYLNAYLPHFLEYYYQRAAKLIHLSTDCVFSGKKPPYRENSKYDGQSFYDRSKALGEVINDKDLTFRMSIVGPDMNKSGTGLFNWFYRSSGEIFGYTNALWTGVTTIELAKAIKAAIEQNLSGLYHLVSETNISKFDLLQLFKEVFKRTDVTIKPKEDFMVDKTLINTRKDFKYNIPDYKTMVEEMKDWMLTHKTLYQHYKVTL